ncbi:MAG: long-chain fatty acid--CoA ligase [Anaerolineae bacterium SM23_ 63]|nr:MAG: long-chain fatty acid--CoA ligase [Anaerolineae bacterium SM23_ 63]HEY46122.1 AMP-binding protein [Anaerolineae bacterium]
MASWLNLGQILKVNAKKFPKTVALKDRYRKFTYPEVNRRVNQLAHSLLALGLSKGDKVAVLLENSIEIVEVYLATAKTGIVIVPINFRLAGSEVAYIVNNSDAQAMIVHDEFTPCVNSIKPELKNITSNRYIVVGERLNGYREYEAFIKPSPESEPEIKVDPQDTWILIYTSGTTGKPKGVVRSHESHIAFYLINAIDFGFNEHDVCLNVMPLCHINSTFFTFTFTYIGGSAYIHPARSFQAEEILEIIEREKISFISLIPTHYSLLLNAQEEITKRDVRSIRKLLCSSAPARKDMKLAVMEFFPGVELYEAYGSTEAGIVTVLKPEDQLRKLGSIGFESLGTDFVKIMDEDGNEVGVGEIGELYSRGPMLFDEYYKMPEKTTASFKGGWFSAGDMARRDEDGYFEIVDRKDNLIITGGEHVYPSEVEKVIGSHPDVLDVAIIGLPDEIWGEAVTAFIIPKDLSAPPDEKEIISFCGDKIAKFKRPKEVRLISEEEMPRTGSGKILHRALRQRLIGELEH